MEKQANRYIAVAYKLYTTEEGETELIEEATADRPFHFLSGFGMALAGFERAVGSLNTGDTFDFVLTKDEAYGDYMEERVVNLDRSIFTINGHFDHDNIYVDAIVPLQNADGNRFEGHVLEITDEYVKMDLNHALAGCDLHFTGSIVEARVATDEEIQAIINRMNGGGCGCGCGGGCDHDHEHDGHGHGGCGHHHDHGGCGHCH